MVGLPQKSEECSSAWGRAAGSLTSDPVCGALSYQSGTRRELCREEGRAPCPESPVRSLMRSLPPEMTFKEEYGSLMSCRFCSRDFVVAFLQSSFNHQPILAGSWSRWRAVSAGQTFNEGRLPHGWTWAVVVPLDPFPLNFQKKNWTHFHS